MGFWKGLACCGSGGGESVTKEGWIGFLHPPVPIEDLRESRPGPETASAGAAGVSMGGDMGGEIVGGRPHQAGLGGHLKALKLQCEPSRALGGQESPSQSEEPAVWRMANGGGGSRQPEKLGAGRGFCGPLCSNSLELAGTLG